MKPVIVIAGQTASGKSDIAISLCKKYNGYIINADSRQVYKELNIGTAKPQFGIFSKNKIKGISHYLYNFVSIKEEYNLFKYKEDVKRILNLPENKNKIPFLVGGTGLYIDSIVFDYKLPKFGEVNDEEIINRIENLNESDKKNPRRLQAASKREQEPSKGNPLPHLYLVIDVEKEEINKRIDQRVENMFDRGLLLENKKFIGSSNIVFQTIGYREFEGYFEGAKTLK